MGSDSQLLPRQGPAAVWFQFTNALFFCARAWAPIFPNPRADNPACARSGSSLILESPLESFGFQVRFYSTSYTRVFRAVHVGLAWHSFSSASARKGQNMQVDFQLEDEVRALLCDCHSAIKN